MVNLHKCPCPDSCCPHRTTNTGPVCVSLPFPVKVTGNNLQLAVKEERLKPSVKVCVEGASFRQHCGMACVLTILMFRMADFLTNVFLRHSYLVTICLCRDWQIYGTSDGQDWSRGPPTMVSWMFENQSSSHYVPGVLTPPEINNTVVAALTLTWLQIAVSLPQFDWECL